jgi:hypothetical protein
MMIAADEAVVVVGEQDRRSKTMDAQLLAAIEDGPEARQALLPKNCPVRLDIGRLPAIDFSDEDTVNEILKHRNPPGRNAIRSRYG